VIGLGVLAAGILVVILFYWYGKSAFDETLVEGGAPTPPIPRRRGDTRTGRTEAPFPDRARDGTP